MPTVQGSILSACGGCRRHARQTLMGRQHGCAAQHTPACERSPTSSQQLLPDHRHVVAGLPHGAACAPTRRHAMDQQCAGGPCPKPYALKPCQHVSAPLRDHRVGEPARRQRNLLRGTHLSHEPGAGSHGAVSLSACQEACRHALKRLTGIVTQNMRMSILRAPPLLARHAT